MEISQQLKDIIDKGLKTGILISDPYVTGEITTHLKKLLADFCINHFGQPVKSIETYDGWEIYFRERGGKNTGFNNHIVAAISNKDDVVLGEY